MRVQACHDRARDFLRVAGLFRLGHLPTEQPHPETRRLSHWARNDLPQAISVLRAVDRRALVTLARYAPSIDRMTGRVWTTLAAGRRVFLCGCGATGRLSMTLESLWRSEHPGNDQVRSFMAGGDVALVHSLEGFEDYPAHGARHLEEMGFEDGDLLIGCTEGGETPYVIGATERAAELSSNPPFFLYCNDDPTLNRHVERFRRIYENRKVHKLCLYVGPMALAGSTRMQASTVLQLAVGLALLHPDRAAKSSITGFRELVGKTDFSFLADFIKTESAIYSAGQYVTYRAGDYGITVFTDTTERAPTFSLVPFDQLKVPRSRYSLCYVSLRGAETAEKAWMRLLNRAPRPLNWPEVDARTTADYLLDFDFSVHALERRVRCITGKTHHEFCIRADDEGIRMRLADVCHVVPVGDASSLFRHTLLKLMLNIHSTLVMGRLGRFENNLMTWVSPTNGKLVDRAIRYVQHLLSGAGRNDLGYDEIARRLFANMDRVKPGESVVLATVRSLNGKAVPALSRARAASRRSIRRDGASV